MSAAAALLRAVCGHDSFSVAGCVHCQAADDVDRDQGLLRAVAAHARATPKQIGFMYADDMAKLEADGRGYVYQYRQAFTVSQDPGCVPVFIHESAP